MRVCSFLQHRTCGGFVPTAEDCRICIVCNRSNARHCRQRSYGKSKFSRSRKSFANNIQVCSHSWDHLISKYPAKHALLLSRMEQARKNYLLQLWHNNGVNCNSLVLSTKKESTYTWRNACFRHSLYKTKIPRLLSCFTNVDRWATSNTKSEQYNEGSTFNQLAQLR